MISVVVPVYGVEKYLDRCLDSIVNQTYGDLEIILVDDGSPDACPQMCDAWAEKDSRIRVIHKRNEGLGMARNAGMDAATGEWISFVDSDDFLDSRTYAECMEKIKMHGADVCFFGMSVVSPNGISRAVRMDFPEALYGERVARDLLPLCFGRLPEDRYEIGSACTAIYSRSLLKEHNIRFRSERELISEDFVFTADVCAAAASVAFVDRDLYCYCRNEASLSRRYRKDRFEKTVDFYKNRIEEIRRLNLGGKTEIRAAVRYWIMVLAAVKSLVNTNELSFGVKLERIRAISRHPLSKALNNKGVKRQLNRKIRFFMLAMKMHLSMGVYLLVRFKQRRP